MKQGMAVRIALLLLGGAYALGGGFALPSGVLTTAGAASAADRADGQDTSQDDKAGQSTARNGGGDGADGGADKARFDSTGFMKSLDLLITEQKRTRAGGTAAADPGGDLILSLRETSPVRENGFLYLEDAAPAGGIDAAAGLSARPDFSSLYTPEGAVRGIEGQTGFAGSSRLGLLSFGADPLDPNDPGFQIALESAFRMTDALQAGGVPTGVAGGGADIMPFSQGLVDQETSLGLSFGYAGFALDASVLNRDAVFGIDGSGTNVGLSYSTSVWSARLSMTEYTQGADLFGIENEARNLISVELGANVRLTDWAGLTGGLRYYDYGSRLLLNPEKGERSQMIFLGGRLRF